MTGSPRLFTPGTAIAAVAILAGVLLVLLRSQPAEKDSNPEAERAALVLLELQTKLLAGAARFDRPRVLAELDQLAGFEDSPAGRRALASFHAYIHPPESRLQALAQLPPAENRDALDHLVARAIGEPSGLSPEERQTLLARMGWFGRLLLASTDPGTAREIDSQSLRAVTLTGGASLALLLALGLGLALLIAALVESRQQALPFRLEPAPERSHLYFQSFAIYLWGMILIPSLVPTAGLAGSALAIGLALSLGLAYPLVRGVSFGQWRADLGFHQGRGILRETVAGVAAYLAMLPLLAAGLGLTFLLQKLGSAATGEDPGPISHPVYGMVPGASPETLALLFVIATALGPLAEEAMFRGALYGALRGVAGRAVSLGLMGFLFAAVHPQGLFAIPSLMAVAICFGIMREWRSSLVAGAVTHGLHNGALLLGVMALLA